MTIHSTAGVEWAARQGFSRVVLARELSLAEVKAIAEDVPEIELEIFAHGALCYGWSGQCLFSSAIGASSLLGASGFFTSVWQPLQAGLAPS